MLDLLPDSSDDCAGTEEAPPAAPALVLEGGDPTASGSSAAAPIAVGPGDAGVPTESGAGHSGPRGAADCVVRFHGLGKIAYYARYSRFEATCEQHGCRLSKSPDASLAGRLAKGRPLGFMSLWLRRQDWFASKEEHLNVFSFAMLASMVDERVEAREFLRSLPEGPRMCEAERPRRHGEPIETADIP